MASSTSAIAISAVLALSVGAAAQAGPNTKSAAKPVDPAPFAALHWRSIGPFRGGRVLAVAGSPDSPLHFYLGAVNGGVWETRDAGRTWPASWYPNRE